MRNSASSCNEALERSLESGRIPKANIVDLGWLLCGIKRYGNEKIRRKKMHKRSFFKARTIFRACFVDC